MTIKGMLNRIEHSKALKNYADIGKRGVMDWYAPFMRLHDPMFIIAWTFEPENPYFFRDKFETFEDFLEALKAWKDRRSQFCIRLWGEDFDQPSTYQTAWTFRRILASIPTNTMIGAINHCQELRERVTKGETNYRLDYADVTAFKMMQFKWLWDWWTDILGQDNHWQPGMGPQRY